MGSHATTGLVADDPRAKTRVGGSPVVSYSCTWAAWSQVSGPHQEIRTFDTTSASGLAFWLSRDPSGLSGGLNLYQYCFSDPVNNFDPDGLRPYVDKYKTVKEAAGQALQDINPTSISQNREYGGMVYRNRDGTYSYNRPWRGGQDWVIINPFPLFRKKAADYHTHAADPCGSDDGEEFSPEDLDDGLLHFLGTPDSWIRQYDPVTGTGIIVGRTPRPGK